jgi:hypothetical protein
MTKDEHRRGLIRMYQNGAEQARHNGFDFLADNMDHAVSVLKETSIEPYIVEEYVTQVEKARRNTKVSEMIGD